MSTEKQKKVAQLIVENVIADKPLNSGDIVEKSGYGETMRLYPKRIIEAKGVQKELEVLGFSERSAKTVVAEIMLNDEANDTDRLRAAEQVFKVKGSYAAEKKVNLNIETNLEIDSETLSLAKQYEEQLKQKL